MANLRGMSCHASITSIHGGQPGKNFGVRIKVLIPEGLVKEPSRSPTHHLGNCADESITPSHTTFLNKSDGSQKNSFPAANNIRGYGQEHLDDLDYDDNDDDVLFSDYIKNI
jgi:hypothetical protein